MKSYKEILFSTKGTVSRKEYRTYLIGPLVVWSLFNFAFSQYYSPEKLTSIAEKSPLFLAAPFILASIFIFLEIFNLSLKRIKDIGLPQIYTILLLAPFYLNYLFILYLLLKEGKEVPSPDAPAIN